MSKVRLNVARVELEWVEEPNSMRACWVPSCFDDAGNNVKVPGLLDALKGFDILEFFHAASAVRVFFPEAEVEEIPFDYGPVESGSMVGR